MQYIIKSAIAWAMLIIVSVFVGTAIDADGKEKNSAAPVIIGCTVQPLVSLVMLAEDRDFFAQEGQPVVFKYFQSGKQAFEALLAGSVDVATVAETPLVFQAFKRNDFSIFSTIGSSRDEQRLVVRPGINKPEDLRGKKIATQHGSAVHFFLHLFLLKHGMTEKDVVLSFKDADELPKALASGEIDAFCMREPFVSEASRLMAKKVKIFKEPDLYVMTFHMVALNQFLKARPDAVSRINRALSRSEEFAVRQPQQAMEIVSRKMKISLSEVRESWHDNDLRVTLEQSLLLSLEDQASWAIENRLVNSKAMPNFLKYINTDSLRALRPAAVTIIR